MRNIVLRYVICVICGFAIFTFGIMSRPLLRQGWHARLSLHVDGRANSSLSSQSVGSTGFPKHYHNRRTLFHSLSQVQSRAVDIVMLGDSITEEGEWNELLPLQVDGAIVVNRGLSCDTTAGLLARLQDVFALKPRLAVVMIGINDFQFRVPPQEILANIQAIVTQLEEAQIAVILHPPLFVGQTDLIPKNANNEISELNQQLKEWYSIRGGIFIDLNETLSNLHSKTLRTDVTEDGLHLNGLGYMLWAAELKKKLLEEDYFR